MTNSLSYLRGAFIAYEPLGYPTKRRVISFRINPESITRTVTLEIGQHQPGTPGAAPGAPPEPSAEGNGSDAAAGAVKEAFSVDAEIRRGPQRHRPDRPGGLRSVRRGGTGDMTLPHRNESAHDWAVERFYGKYEGVVTDVTDPKNIGRIKALVPAVLGEQVETGWALPCVPAGGSKDAGMLFLPKVGATVWMEFAGGDVDQPIWAGTFWGAPDSIGGRDDLGTKTGAETPTGDGGKQATARLSVLRTSSGHELTLDDDGEVVLLANGNGKSSLRFKKDGTVVITAEKIQLGSSAGEKVVLGNTFMDFFNKHQHPTGVGPSGPPSQQMSPSHLSSSVTTE